MCTKACGCGKAYRVRFCKCAYGQGHEKCTGPGESSQSCNCNPCPNGPPSDDVVEGIIKSLGYHAMGTRCGVWRQKFFGNHCWRWPTLYFRRQFCAGLCCLTLAFSSLSDNQVKRGQNKGKVKALILCLLDWSTDYIQVAMCGNLACSSRKKVLLVCYVAYLTFKIQTPTHLNKARQGPFRVQFDTLISFLSCQELWRHQVLVIIDITSLFFPL